jgi:hypothetical protein
MLPCYHTTPSLHNATESWDEQGDVRGQRIGFRKTLVDQGIRQIDPCL